jgi:hypothetical protein
VSATTGTIAVSIDAVLGSAALTASTDYAPAAQGVTGGNSHDHSGGDGAQIAYSSLSGTPSLGTAAAKNVGTAAGNVVELDGSARLPAVDGSQLTGINTAGTDLTYTAASRILASSTGADATLPLFTSTDAGLAPSSGGGTANFLRADGTFAAPPGGSTDLSYTASTRLLASSTGTDVTLPLFTSTDAGLVPSSGGGTTTFLRADGTFATAGSPPGGSDGQIQVNDGGVFAGFIELVWNKLTKVLRLAGDLLLDDGGTFTTTVQTVTPTANRTISFPNATGTIGLVAGSSGQLVYNASGANAGASTLTYDGSILTSSGRFINSYNAAASSPAKAFTGTWFTGGTSTTTKPQVLIEPTGTTSTAWSTSGTGFGVNAASGFAGNLLDLQVNGTSRLAMSADGRFSALPTGGGFWTGASIGGVYYRTSAGLAVAGPNNANVFSIGSGFAIAWSVTATADSNGHDLTLFRDAANTLAQRNGTNAQTFRVYGTYTDASNHVRAALSSTSTAVTLAAETAGTGADDIPLNLTAAGTGTVKVNSNLEISTKNIVTDTTTGTQIGTGATQKLAFFGQATTVQPAAVANITTTATAGTLPTADGTVTIADAATPTVTELLEYCVELESKLEAALGHLRTLGLIAT